MNDQSSQNWLKQNRHPIQLVALGVAILAPFGVYYFLQSGQPTAAWVCFILLAAALGLNVIAS